MSDVGMTEADVTAPVPKKRGAKPGRPKPPGSGRQKGVPNKGPKVAQDLANRYSPEAVEHLRKCMQFQRFAINGEWVWPTIYAATQAAMKILDLAEMPSKEKALSTLGDLVQVNINIGGSAPPPVIIDGQAAHIGAAE